MAQRLWTPFDMVGVGGVSMMRGRSNVSAVTPGAAGSPVNTITAQRQSGTPDTAQSFRDDFRPVLGAVNGIQTVLFDTSTRQLQIGTPGNLPSGTGSKGWCFAGFIRETRTDDRYTWGYGGNNQTGVAHKLRQGAVPYSDVGSTGYAIGSIPVATSGITVIVESYNGATVTSRANLNGNTAFTEYAKARNTSATNARLGSWPLYGNGSSHDFGYLVWWTSGDATTDDLLRLAAFCSWDSGDAGAGLHASNPYKSAAPTIEDGTGGATGPTGSAAVTLASVSAASAAALAITGAAVLASAPITTTSTGSAPIAAQASPIVGAVAAAGAGGLAVAGTSAMALGGITSTSTALLPIAGQSAAQIGEVSAAASASLPVVGISSAALGAVSTASTARADITAAAAARLAPVTASGTGGSTPLSTGQAAIALAPVTTAGTGTLRLSGTAVPALGAVAAAGAGQLIARGQAAPVLGDVTNTAAGTAPRAARAAAQLAPVAVSASAVLPIAAASAASLAPVTVVSGGLGDPDRPSGPTVILPQHRFVVPARQRSFTVPRRPRAFLISKGKCMSSITKYPAEERQYQADWTPDLAGQTITGNPVASSSDLTLIVDQISMDGAIMKYWLRGGTSGRPATIRFVAATSGGEDLVFEQTVICY